MSKLSCDDVKKLKDLYQSTDLSQSKLAKMFNIKQPHVSRIINETRRSLS